MRPVDTGRGVSFRVGQQSVSERWLLKTNVLYWAALTPNLGVEAGLGPKTSLEVTAGYSSWGSFTMIMTEPGMEAKKKAVEHFLVKPEFRYWLGERFRGHFFGVQGLYMDYRTQNIEIPIFSKKGWDYDGHGFGGGLTYGYRLSLGGRWGAEFHATMGVLGLKYDQTPSEIDRETMLILGRKTYIGPIGAGAKISFAIR